MHHAPFLLVFILLLLADSFPTSVITPLDQFTAEGERLLLTGFSVNSSSSLLTLTLTSSSGNAILSVENVNGVSVKHLKSSAINSLPSSSLEFTATVPHINATLEKVAYDLIERPYWNGQDSLTVTLTDDSTTPPKTTSKVVIVNVKSINTPPVWTLPANFVTVDEDVETNIGQNVSVADVDAGDTAQVKCTISTSDGSISIDENITNVTVQKVLKSDISFTGTITSVNAALATLSFLSKPNKNSRRGDIAKITFSLDDNGNTGDDIVLDHKITSAVLSVYVTAVNDAPTLTAPVEITAKEENTLQLVGISVADVDADETFGATVELSIETKKGGHLSLSRISGLYVTESTDTKLKFQGSISNVNTALEGLTYTGQAEFNGDDIIEFSVSDLGNTGKVFNNLQASKMITVHVLPVSDPPQILLPTIDSNLACIEDKQLVIAGVTIKDPDTNGRKLLLHCTVEAIHGSISIETNYWTQLDESSTSKKLSFTSSLERMNLALSKITYSPMKNWNSDNKEPDRIRVLVSETDAHGNQIGASTEAYLFVFVKGENDEASVKLKNSGNSLKTPIDTPEDEPFIVGNHAEIEDPDSLYDVPPPELKVILETEQYGKFSLNGVPHGITVLEKNQFQKLELQGRLKRINEALSMIQYQPNIDWTGSTFIEITVNNSKKTLNLNVTGINDAPLVETPIELSCNEDQSIQISNIKVTDPDVSPEDKMTVTVSVSNGTLIIEEERLTDVSNLKFISGQVNQLGDLFVFAGNLKGINDVLQTLAYYPGQDWTGEDEIEIRVNDHGNAGAGGAQISTKTIKIIVNPINDAPIITLPDVEAYGGFISVAESRTLHIQGLSVSDVDDIDQNLVLDVTISTDYCLISFQDFQKLAGINFLSKPKFSPFSSSAVQFTGSIQNINIALSKLLLKGPTSFSGIDTVTILVSDLSESNSTTKESFQLTIDAMNDPPTISFENDLIYAKEDEEKSVDVVTINDTDVGTNGLLSMTITVDYGMIKLAHLDLARIRLDVGKVNQFTSLLRFEATLSQLQLALNNLRYKSKQDWNSENGEIDRIKFALNDLGNSGSGGAQETIKFLNVYVSAVNDAPSINAPQSIKVKEKTETRVEGIRINDVDVDESFGGVLEVSIVAMHGTLSIYDYSGLHRMNKTLEKTLQFQASLASTNNALKDLMYTGDDEFSGEDALKITVSDLGNTGSGDNPLITSYIINIVITSVNNPPSLSLPDEEFIAVEDEEFIFHGISVTDAENDPLSIQVCADHGTIYFNGIKIDRTSKVKASKCASMQGQPAKLNSALAEVVYTSDKHWNSLGENGNDMLHWTLTDRKQKNDSTYTPSLQWTSQIYVRAVNNPPKIESPKAIVVSQNIEAKVDNVRVSDVDLTMMVGRIGEVTVTATVTHGSIGIRDFSKGLTFNENTSKTITFS
eukprot:g5705.t1